MTTLEIRDKKATLKKEATDIIEGAKNDIRELTEEEKEKIQSIKDEIKSLTEELERLEKELSGEEEETNETKSKRSTMKFNLLTAIRDIANNKQLDNVSTAVISAGADEMRKAGISYQGQIQLPTENRSVSVNSEGDDLVATDITNILEPLRAKNVLVEAGAKFMTGLIGDVQIPVMNPSNVAWAGEIADASDANVTFDSVKLSPKRLTAYVDISKQFLAQDSVDAEAMIKADIVNAINTKLEATILGNEAGTTTKPAGLFYTSGSLDTISDFGDITDLEADVEDANVMGECKYIVSNKAKAALRVMAKGTSNTASNVMENGEIDGTAVFNTSNVYSTGVAFGDWSNLVIGQWGAIDLTVDPFTQAKNGCVRLVVNAYIDAKVVREGTIAVATV